MRKRYLTYTVLLLAAWLCAVTSVYGQRTDSAASATADTVKQEEPDEDSTSTLVTADSAKTYLNKFSLKEQNTVVHERAAPQGDWKKLTADKEFWYANRPVPPDAPPPTWIGTVFWVVFWVLAAALVAGIVVVCVRVFGGGRSGRGKNIALPDEEAAEEENIFNRDFDALVAKALSVPDYRLATRLLFLRLLRTMAEKNIIQYSMEKTNLDYLFELGGSRYVKDFLSIARNYEYVWYGHFDIQQSQFMLLRQRLDDFNRLINN